MATPVPITFTGMDNVSDPANLDITKGIGTLLQNVDTDNGGGISTRKGYSTVLAGNYRSSYSDGVHCYLVSGYSIYSFNGVSVSLVTMLTDNKAPVSFTAVNDVVAYSNGIDFGIIENGVAHQCPVPAKKFKKEMAPGTALAFMTPYLLSASGNTLYRSDPLRCDQMDLRTCVMAVFRDEILVVLPVDDGCYVGTVNETWWLGGTTDDTASQRILAHYGAVKGTGIVTTAEKVRVLQSAGTVAMWTSHEGICAGGNSGQFVNLSAGKFAVPKGISGAAMLREQNGLTHYVACLDTTSEAYNYYTSPPLDIDSSDI